MEERRCPICKGRNADCWACGGTGDVDPSAVRRAVENRARTMDVRKEAAWGGLKRERSSNR